MAQKTVRTTVVLPEEVFEKLKRFVPNRQRSQFIAEAIEQHLLHRIFQQGRELSFGAWKSEDYPHLQSKKDVARYIADLRSEDSWRTPPGEES